MKSRFTYKFALAAAVLLVSGQVMAQATAPVAEPDWTLSGNAGLFSDYRFRGISQTNKQPAIQGGVDFAMKNGLYLGNWNSNVDSAMYNGANIEMDFYGGYKATFGDFGLDVGGIYYLYPGSGANSTTKIKNGELYIGGSWGPLVAKYSYAVTDFFSTPDSKGSWYLNHRLEAGRHLHRRWLGDGSGLHLHQPRPRWLHRPVKEHQQRNRSGVGQQDLLNTAGLNKEIP